jgi:hypothetical protein
MVLPVVGPTPSCIEELQALLIEERDFISRDAVHGPLSRDSPLHKSPHTPLRSIKLPYRNFSFKPLSSMSEIQRRRRGIVGSHEPRTCPFP